MQGTVILQGFMHIYFRQVEKDRFLKSFKAMV